MVKKKHTDAKNGCETLICRVVHFYAIVQLPPCPCPFDSSFTKTLVISDDVGASLSEATMEKRSMGVNASIGFEKRLWMERREARRKGF